MMTNAEKQAALRMRTKNIEAIAEAHVDAGHYGQGWLTIDENGNLKRINPSEIIVIWTKEVK